MTSLKGLKVGLCILFAIGFVLTFVATSSATPEEHLETLYKAAKAEKEVIFQTHGAANVMEPFAKAFETRYPDMKVSIISIGSTAIGTRLIAEAGAKKISVDVGTAGLAYLLPMMERDLLVQYDWAKNMGVDPGKLTFDNRFVDYMHSPRLWVYNTKLVQKAEAPKSWEDLLNPRWKGNKIVIRAAPSGFSWIFPAWKKDKEKVTAFLKEFAKQDVNPGKRDAMMANQLAGGEFPIGTIAGGNALRLIEQKAPLTLTSMGTTAADAVVFFIPKGAPHPNAALLFMAWATSKQGSEEMTKTGDGPAWPPDASPMAKMMADAGIGFEAIKTEADIKEYSGPFSDTVMKIMNFMPQ